MHTGEWLRAQRSRAGISLEEANFRMRGLLPRTYWMATSTFHRLERNADPDPVVVFALAHIYGADLATLPDEGKEQLDSVRDLLNRATGCSPGVDPFGLKHVA